MGMIIYAIYNLSTMYAIICLKQQYNTCIKGVLHCAKEMKILITIPNYQLLIKPKHFWI